MNTYDNNNDRPTVTTYTPISFANPDSALMASRLSISYFNRMMAINISPRNPATPNETYPTYNREGSIQVFLSYSQAKFLHDGFKDIIHGNSKHHSVCIETKNGMFMLNDGIDKGTDPYAAIYYMNKGSSNQSIIYYQFKRNYELPCDYSENKYDVIKFPDHEIDTLLMVFESYYNAASYAIAATVAESGMYRQKFVSDSLKSIAGKVGAQVYTGKSNSSNSGYSFLNNATQNSYDSNSTSSGFDPTTALTGGTDGVASKAPTFDDVISSSMSSFDD